MRYRVTFPHPVGRFDGGIAATLAYAEPREDDPFGEVQLAQQVLAYLKGIGVLDPHSKDTADALLLAGGGAGTGTVWRHGKRIGKFHLDRLGEPDADAQ